MQAPVRNARSESLFEIPLSGETPAVDSATSLMLLLNGLHLRNEASLSWILTWTDEAMTCVWPVECLMADIPGLHTLAARLQLPSVPVRCHPVRPEPQPAKCPWSIAEAG